jgi:diaminohydroxyphosphoribosylaminopyrimidine deaminase/5-amino-6-(5-phosphoribosylamino)uracil reductase
MGAVLVGVGTVRADDPNLTAPIEGVVNQPVRIILDPSNSINPESRVFRPGGRVLHFVAKADTAEQVELPLEHGAFPIDKVLEELWKQKITSLLVEGGGNTIGGFLEAGVCDRLHLFFAPKLIGSGLSFTGGFRVDSLDHAFKLRLISETRLGEDLWLTFDQSKFEPVTP